MKVNRVLSLIAAAYFSLFGPSASAHAQTINVFEAPDAGIGPGQGTVGIAINPGGTIVGALLTPTACGTVFCDLGTAPLRHSTFRAPALALAKAPLLEVSAPLRRRVRSSEPTLIRTE